MSFDRRVPEWRAEKIINAAFERERRNHRNAELARKIDTLLGETSPSGVTPTAPPTAPTPPLVVVEPPGLAEVGR